MKKKLHKLAVFLLSVVMLFAIVEGSASAAPSTTGPYIKVRLYEIRPDGAGKYQVTADVWLFRATGGVEFTLDYDESCLTPSRMSDNQTYSTDSQAASGIKDIFQFAPSFQQDLTHSPTTVDLAGGVIRTGFLGNIVTRSNGTDGLPLDNPDMGNGEIKENGLRYRPGVLIGQDEGLWIGTFSFSSATDLTGKKATELFSVPDTSSLVRSESVIAHVPSSVGYRFSYHDVTKGSAGILAEIEDTDLDFLRLFNLSTSPVSLNETFGENTLSYTVNVPSDMTTLSVRAWLKAPAQASLKINGSPAISGASVSVSITGNGQVIPVEVSAGAGYQKKTLTYNITVVQTSQRTQNTLTGLELHDQLSKSIVFTPTFRDTTTQYDATVYENDVTGVSIKPLLTGVSGIQKVECTVGTTVAGTTDTTPSAPMTMNAWNGPVMLSTLNGSTLPQAGDTITVTVIATPVTGSPTTYTITIHVNAQTTQEEGARLRALNLRDVNNRQVPFSPTFARNTFAYTAPAPSGRTTDINRLYVVPFNPNATIKVFVDGVEKYDTATSPATSPFALTTGDLQVDSVIRVEVTAIVNSIPVVEIYTITLEGLTGYITGKVNPYNTKATQNPTEIKAFASGKVDWENPISVAQNRNSPDETVLVAVTEVGEKGAFELELEPGTYDILIDKGGFLDYVVRGVPLTMRGSVVMNVDIGLKVITPGDVNRSEYGGFKDGIIDEKDVSAITGSAFNSTSPDYAYLRIYCDFNNDKDVNSMDYSIMIDNIGARMTIEDY